MKSRWRCCPRERTAHELYPFVDVSVRMTRLAQPLRDAREWSVSVEQPHPHPNAGVTSMQSLPYLLGTEVALPYTPDALQQQCQPLDSLVCLLTATTVTPNTLQHTTSSVENPPEKTADSLL